VLLVHLPREIRVDAVNAHANEIVGGDLVVAEGAERVDELGGDAVDPESDVVVHREIAVAAKLGSSAIAERLYLAMNALETSCMARRKREVSSSSALSSATPRDRSVSR
jgi:hypothetical protein